MNSEKISGNSSIRPAAARTPQNSEIPRGLAFVRSEPPSQSQRIEPSSAASITSDPGQGRSRIGQAFGSFSNGNVNISNQLRLALLNNGADYSYREMKNHPTNSAGGKPQRHTIHLVKSEFAFGVSPEVRTSLFDTLVADIAKGRSSGRHFSDVFTNPDAVNSLRKQAVIWSQRQGNDIHGIPRNDGSIKDFFRSLEPEVPEKYRPAISAMIEQPPEYRQPLPGTASAELAERTLSTNRIAGLASSQAVLSSPAGSEADPRQSGATSTGGKRSFSSANAGSASVNDPSQTFKRSRPDDMNRAFPLLSSYGAQPTSFSVTPKFAGQLTVQHQTPPIPPMNNALTPTDPGGAFQGASSFDSPLPSFWSLTHGMIGMNAQPQIPQPASMTLTAGERSFSSANSEPTSVDSPSPAQERSLPEDVNEAFPLPASYSAQPSSFSSPADFVAFQGASSLDPLQPDPWPASNEMNRMSMQPQPQTYQLSNPANAIYQANVHESGQYFDHSQIQAPQVQPAHDPWRSSYQGNVIQGGPSFEPLHPDESSVFSSANLATHYQATPYMPYQSSNIDQGGVFQAFNANSPAFVSQPNYGASGDPGSFNQTNTQDAEWNRLMAAFDATISSMKRTS